MPAPKAKGLFTVCPKSGRVVGYNFGSWWACALFPLIGFLALLWVVVRVGPKPSRAAYPCQRAALPLASGFVVWILGAVGWLSFSGWLKSRLAPRRRAVLAVGLVSLAVLALWSVVGAPPPPAAAATPTEGANAPIGTARGIYPGRVVWSRDPGAAHWSQATGTHWWDPDQTDQARVDTLMSQGLRSVTGAASDAAAWDALFKHFNQRRGAGAIGYAQSANKKIVVKINQNPANESNNTNYAKNGCNNENAITGNPHLIRALIAQLVNQAGALQADITIYDASGLNRGWGGPRTIGDNIYTYNHADFPGVHFMDGLGLQGRELAAWPAFESVHYVTGMGGDENKGKKIVQQVLDAGFLINMAVMKSHGDGPTLCAKNHYGTVDGQRHGPLYGNSGYYSNLVELMGHKDLGEKTVLFLIDTIYGSSGPNNVPSKWAKEPFNGDWPSSVLLSQDGVAIDSVGFDFLNAEFGQPQNTDYHLHDAAYIPGTDGKKLSGVAYAPNVGSTATIGSLGVHEHWNSATDRKYTRNLGTGSGIELVALSTAPQPPPAGPGTGITREWWTGIAGTAVADLTGNAAFPNSPTGRATLTSLFETPTDWADNYGTRIRGTVIAPATGDYVFWIASDDNAELWLSTDTSPANKAKIASVSGWTGSREWTKLAGQQSAAIRLTAGQRYYVEALQKEGTGGDNLAVGWRFPNGALERPIPYHRLAPWVDTYALTVNGGGGDGSYAAGATVTITADAAPLGQVFDRWRIDAGSPTLANATSATTTLTMPASAAAVTAIYTAAPATFALTVNGGSGGGSYAAGAAVTIVAGAPPAGQVFDRWRVDAGTPTLADAAAATTTLTMPASSATVTSTYKAAPPPDTGTGLWAEVFDNADFTMRKLSRVDASVSFDWGAGSPDASVGADAFSVRWSGAVQPRYTETYTFTTTTDDGVRLWVDGQLLVDKWVNQGPTDWSGTIALAAGRKYGIRMDYYENGGGAVAKLAWSSASQAREIVPQGRLFPWASRDIGTVGVAGSDAVAGANFTVKGSGADIWNNADAFRFVYKVLTGDGEVQVKVSSVQNTNGWAKAGVMVRETLAADARHAFMALTPGNGLAFQRRTSVGGSSVHTSGGAAAAPRWVRLVRQGGSLSGYASADGAAWTWIGTETIAMGPVVYAGLAVTSHDNAVLCTAQFDGAAVTAGPDASVAPLVAVASVSTGKPYSLATAQVGALPYIDRSYTVTALGAALSGGVLVRTSNDDKYITTASHLALTLGQSAQVYVCYDKRGTLPAWLGDGTWTTTAESFVSTDGAASPMRVYRKTVPAGGLALGGNLAGGASGALADYVVVVQPATAAKPGEADLASALFAPAVFAPGPVPPDRWLHEADRDGDGMAEMQDGDGDGLWNTFEPGYGVDVDLPDTDADGGPDEGVTVPDGRTLWDVQEGFPAGGGTGGGGSPGGGDDGGGSRCGSIGLDLLAPLAALWLLRRRRKSR